MRARPRLAFVALVAGALAASGPSALAKGGSILLLVVVGSAYAQKTVSFSTGDGGVIYADLYGQGERAVVLAHGGRFNKESWAKQARILASAGFRVLAIDFRGYGQSRGPGDADLG